MVIRYQWKCDKPGYELSRIEVLLPKVLKDVLTDAAPEHDISRNAFVAGVLHWISQANTDKRLRIQIDDTGVNVTELIPGLRPGDPPVQSRKV